ncbi:hypothetical protein TREMEDRAFT_27503, partial [Tremella mesenterica DSM 1558]|uniref:uncharacterized protein n=1 Tax=Tremella mesenterica (strain ATCC 24925 / CBS 8224 / DSM 1558 / NBRC 9311 / NRRL Y-6157 / RJB 2259-6 / UBC 559-6) TaxID=578456 RepID=UPI0003F48F6F
VPPAYDDSSNPLSGDKGEQAGKTQEIQKVMQETIGIMQENINKVTERQERLDALQDKSDQLQARSALFRSSATATRRKMWLKDMKWKIILIVVILFILAGIIGGAVKGTQH